MGCHTKSQIPDPGLRAQRSSSCYALHFSFVSRLWIWVALNSSFSREFLLAGGGWSLLLWGGTEVEGGQVPRSEHLTRKRRRRSVHLARRRLEHLARRRRPRRGWLGGGVGCNRWKDPEAPELVGGGRCGERENHFCRRSANRVKFWEETRKQSEDTRVWGFLWRKEGSTLAAMPKDRLGALRAVSCQLFQCFFLRL